MISESVNLLYYSFSKFTQLVFYGFTFSDQGFIVSFGHLFIYAFIFVFVVRIIMQGILNNPFAEKEKGGKKND